MGGVCKASERWGKGKSPVDKERNRNIVFKQRYNFFKVTSYLPLQVRRDIPDLKLPTPADKLKKIVFKKNPEKTLLQDRLYIAVSYI